MMNSGRTIYDMYVILYMMHIFIWIFRALGAKFGEMN